MPELKLVTLTIDEKEITVPGGTLVIEAAKKLGIEIPRYCYHPKLAPVGSCRVCLVEVEGMPKLQTSCTLVVQNGMIVKTDTPRVNKRRKGVIEFLLANHPLDCPVCDQGGECTLQDFSLKFGPAVSRFIEQKRTFEKYDIGPLVEREMNRCILCRRCTRFYEEYGGTTTLGEFGRAAKTDIGTLYRSEFNPGFSGNTIFLCPVGALTDKVYRFKARVAEMRSTVSVCPHCGTGCNVKTWTRNNQIMRITPVGGSDLLDGFLCDKGQFGFQYVSSGSRLKAPLIKKNGSFIPSSYDDALNLIVSQFKKRVSENGADSVGGIVSAGSSCEEIYLFQKLFKEGFGSNNIDFRMNIPHNSGEVGSVLDGSLEYSHLATSDGVFVFGVNPLEEQPVLGAYLRNRAKTKNTALFVAHPLRTGLEDCAEFSVRYKPGTEVYLIYGIISFIWNAGMEEKLSQITGFREFKQQVERNKLERIEEITGVSKEIIRKISAALLARNSLTIITNGEKEDLLLSAHNLSLFLKNAGKKEIRSGILPIFPQPNYRGAMKLISGNFNTGKIIDDALSGKLKALYILHSDPVFEFPDRGKIKAALKNLEFLVVQDIFLTETAEFADVVLPGKSPHAKDGSFVCSGGMMQNLQAGIKEDVADEWKTITHISNGIGYPMKYGSIDEIRNEITPILQKKESGGEKFAPVSFSEKAEKLPYTLLEEKNMFAGNRFILHCNAINAFFKPHAVLNPSDAGNLGLHQGDMVKIFNGKGELTIQVSIREDVPPGCIVMTNDIASPLNILTNAGEEITEVDIRKI